MESNNEGFKIELKEEVAEGVYSNLAVIAHSSSEFVMDFVRIMPGVAKAQVKSRVIMTPEHAKRLVIALQDNLRRYERQFGEVRLPERADFVPSPAVKGEA
jgi:hypothetical protein